MSFCAFLLWLAYGTVHVVARLSFLFCGFFFALLALESVGALVERLCLGVQRLGRRVSA